ncbi:MAG: bifunctional 5,10-methylenetetrahydrofolate dehydrogenase/5,10-methenyltetrahydrofolate cyclohydrolase [Patescibacteria group bacterium]
MAHILNGKKLSIERAEKLKETVSLLPTQPTLVIIQIGDVAESNIYIQGKTKMAEKIGARVQREKYSANISEKEIIKDIEKFNQDKSVHGIIIQLPIPESLDKNSIIDVIDPNKDVDGLTAQNIKQLCINNTGIIPATTKGILTLCKENNIVLQGKHIAIMGRSTLVGKPTMLACVNENATVTLCHSYTKDLEKITQSADIIITATGTRNLITKNHVRTGQIIIDVGIHAIEEENRKVSGDVSYDEVAEIVESITPVPGGVGPMTVISLFENLVDAYKKHAL